MNEQNSRLNPAGNHQMNQNTQIKKTLLLLTMCLSLLSQSAARAGLMAYEGFNYSASGSPSLSGLNGGIGWSNGWVNVSGGGGVVSSNNLILGNQGAAGFDARSLGNSAFVSNARRAGRFLDRSIGGNFGSHGYLDGSGRVGADGKTLYVSFLQQPNVTTLFYEFEFHRADLGDPGGSRASAMTSIQPR